jgi:hypothetical protein
MDADRMRQVLESGRFDQLTVAQARELIASDIPLTGAAPRSAWYFGCGDRVGHYLHDRHLNSLYGTADPRVEPGADGRGIRPRGCPWSRLDGGLLPDKYRQGLAAHYVQDGWTAIAFTDNSIDNRPGSHSTFLLEAELGFDEALAHARRLFPSVFARFDFEIVRAQLPS